MDRNVLPDLAEATPADGRPVGDGAARCTAGAVAGDAAAQFAASRRVESTVLRVPTPARVVEVAVTLPVAGRFHYSVPEPMASRAVVGARVLVRFGGRKATAVVVRTDTTPPEGVAPVAISEVLDAVPALSVELVELCTWIAEYRSAAGRGDSRGAACRQGARRGRCTLTAGRGVRRRGGAGAAAAARAGRPIGDRELPAAGSSLASATGAAGGARPHRAPRATRGRL